MSFIGDQNSLNFSVKKGWYSLEILGGYAKGEPIFDLRLATCDAKPKFSADLQTSFWF